MSDIISKLINDGAYYWDFRAGSFESLGNTSAVGSPTSARFTGDGLSLDDGGYVTVSNTAALQALTSFTLVYYGDIGSKAFAYNARIITKGSSPRQFDWYVADDLQSAGIRQDGLLRIITADQTNAKYLAIGVTSGSTPTGYIDGQSIGAYSGAVTISGTTDDILIGNYPGGSYTGKFQFRAILLILGELTATEHAELFAYLENAPFPTVPSYITEASIGVDPSETGLVGAWDMRPNGATVPDLSDGGHDGTIDGARHEKTNLCETLYGGNNLDVGDVEAKVKTIAFWQKLGAVGAGTLVVLTATDTITVSGGSIATTLTSPTIYVNGTTDDTATAGVWMHVVVTSATGVAADDVLLATGIGRNGPVKMYSDVKDANWVKRDYQLGRYAAFMTGFGARDNLDYITAGALETHPLGNSGWNVPSQHSARIITDPVIGKCITNASSGTSGAFRTAQSMGHTPSEMLNGEHIFWMIKGNSFYNLTIYLIDTDRYIGLSTNGFSVTIGSSEKIYCSKITAGNVTTLFASVETITPGTPFKLGIKIDRLNCSLYINDTLLTSDGSGLGTNPFELTTHTEAKYVSILSTNTTAMIDRVALSDQTNKYKYTKRFLP